MAKVVYSDLDGSAPRVSWGVYSFLDGVAVDIDDSAFLSKISGNPFFAVVADAAPAPSDPPPAPPSDDERQALIAQAAALGIQIDGRWGNARLLEEINKAKA